ncbi:unnamed protein product [Ceutorhynchus assimilis]|uniref:Pacifastin domain-containing protein n=1 Tax=Ceutorhynchus assimilis TaxID=467358 RepID=A0A9N9QES3_9CUCU|nr:unnamed protein product [Ceutorhynchus assimilis]
MIKFFVIGVLILATVSSEHLDPPPNQNAPCKDGDTTSFDNCNNCHCSGGNWACTLKLCFNPDQIVKRSVHDPEASCRDGDVTSFDNGCNSCICGNGNWACTMKFCLDSDSRTKRHGLTKECTPNQTKRENCNNCFCTPTGIWSCTKIGCNKKREAIAAGFDARRIQSEGDLLVQNTQLK